MNEEEQLNKEKDKKTNYLEKALKEAKEANSSHGVQYNLHEARAYGANEQEIKRIQEEASKAHLEKARKFASTGGFEPDDCVKEHLEEANRFKKVDEKTCYNIMAEACKNHAKELRRLGHTDCENPDGFPLFSAQDYPNYWEHRAKKYEKKSKIGGRKMTLKTLGLIGLLALGLNSCEYGELETKSTKQSQLKSTKQIQQYSIKPISGEIIHIDEDSFGVFYLYIDAGGAGSFEFENIRIKANDGEIYKLIYPGPTSYAVGDTVKNLRFEQLSNKSISYSSLASSILSTRLIIQKGSVEADGIIK